ncbi:unnamed protein product, partial [Ascophyllum nodosum]
MKPARFSDAVKLQQAWKDGGSDSPSKLMAIMYAQLDKFEATEEIQGVRISNTVSDKPKDKRQGKDIGRVGKETAGKRNGSKTSVNVDDGVKTFWSTCFVCGEQGHNETTDGLQVTLQAPHGRISFRVASVILPGSDDVMLIDSKTLRESVDIDIVQAFHQ